MSTCAELYLLWKALCYMACTLIIISSPDMSLRGCWDCSDSAAAFRSRMLIACELIGELKLKWFCLTLPCEGGAWGIGS